MKTLFVTFVLAVSCNCVVADDTQKVINFINGFNDGVRRYEEQQRQQDDDDDFAPVPPATARGERPSERAEWGPNSNGNTNQGNTGISDFGQSNGRRIQWVQPNNNGGYVQPYPAGYINSGGQNFSEPPLAPIRYSNLPITISCPEESDGICSYQLIDASGNSNPYTIGRGQKQNLKENTTWTIRYAPGPGLPQKTYKVRGGQNYSLQRDPNGHWQCYLAR